MRVFSAPGYTDPAQFRFIRREALERLECATPLRLDNRNAD